MLQGIAGGWWGAGRAAGHMGLPPATGHAGHCSCFGLWCRLTTAAWADCCRTGRPAGSSAVPASPPGCPGVFLIPFTVAQSHILQRLQIDEMALRCLYAPANILSGVQNILIMLNSSVLVSTIISAHYDRNWVSSDTTMTDHLADVQEMQSMYALVGAHSSHSCKPVEAQQQPPANGALWPKSIPDSASRNSVSSAGGGSATFSPQHRAIEPLIASGSVGLHSNSGCYGSPAVSVGRVGYQGLAESVPHADAWPQMETPLRAPLSPTAANRACRPSVTGPFGPGKVPQLGPEPHDPLVRPAARSAQHSRGSVRSSGRSGQKRGNEEGAQLADGRSPTPDQDAAGQQRKHYAVSKNEAQGLARRSGAAAAPSLAAWTQNSDDTDDFMI